VFVVGSNAERQPLEAPPVRPFTNCFCRARKTRSPDGRLYRGRTGVARLAVAAGVPIIPVGMLGTDKVQPIGQPYPALFRGKIVVRFGKPIETTGRADDRTSLRALTDDVMGEIQKLTGQEYVPRYAPAKPTS
jgi:1-acyl-sn-glycerol-3-phosphate acyltransferase